MNVAAHDGFCPQTVAGPQRTQQLLVVVVRLGDPVHGERRRGPCLQGLLDEPGQHALQPGAARRVPYASMYHGVQAQELTYFLLEGLFARQNRIHFLNGLFYFFKLFQRDTIRRPGCGVTF